MGSFLEPPAAIMILTPLLLPIVRAIGMDPIHFGIVIAVNLSIGMYTPPFGLNLLATQAVLKSRMSEIYRGAMPFRHDLACPVALPLPASGRGPGG